MQRRPQHVDAQAQHPEREDEVATHSIQPVVSSMITAPTVSEPHDPLRHDLQSNRQRRRRDHEHGGHAHRVDREQRAGHPPAVRPHRIVWRHCRQLSGDTSSPAATAPVQNSIATNSSPLPRNTVAKKRSSFSPMRSRTTPMNHRKAIPANGNRLRAIDDRAPAVESSMTQSPASVRALGDGEVDEDLRGAHQHGEHDAGDRRGPRRADRLLLASPVTRSLLFTVAECKSRTNGATAGAPTPAPLLVGVRHVALAFTPCRVRRRRW